MTSPATGSRQVFVDTSAHYALTDRSDTSHGRARQVLERLATERRQLVTTNFVLAETHALLLARLGRDVVVRVVGQIRTGTTAVVRLTRADEERAWAIIERYADKDFSFTDAASFAVMERLKIDEAFTFDGHFAQYGLTMLP